MSKSYANTNKKQDVFNDKSKTSNKNLTKTGKDNIFDDKKSNNEESPNSGEPSRRDSSDIILDPDRARDEISRQKVKRGIFRILNKQFVKNTRQDSQPN